MLRFNLTAVFKARGIERPTQYLMQCGFSSGTATKIKSGRSDMLNMRHVEMLCEKLNCTPNDLIEWIPSDKQKAVTNHPLAPLQNKNYAEEVMQLVNALPFEKLQQLAAMVKEIK
ncbi:MAG TPA: helix-turn-helix transcriptional regulator [Panacibacter sp.]|nr:helix-turn-helix transcriptional regulator [Panacibacter sp.]